MRKIISIELQKIKAYPIFWVISGIALGLYLIFSFVPVVFKIDFMVGAEEVAMKNYVRFPHIWNTNTWIGSWFIHILSLLIIILIGNEFAFRTFKQHLIDGLKREELFIGKLFLIFLLALGFTLLIFITSLIYGFITTKGINAGLFFGKTYFLLTFFLQAFVFMSMAMFVAYSFKNTALSIIIYLAYFIFEWVFRIILMFMKSDILYYFPAKLVGNLTSRPKLTVAISDQMGDAIVQQGLTFFSVPMYQTIIISVVYLAIFLSLTFLLQKKRNF